MNTKTIFCANCQKDTPHSIGLNPVDHGEIMLTCPCGRFIKVPASMDAGQINAHLAAHRESNEGQMTQEAIGKKEQAFIDMLADK